VIDGDSRNRDTLSGPWPHQEPEYADAKSSLHSHLRSVREAMLSKLEGLSEYDIRRPLTPTGTNLLGLIKHLSIVEARYFGESFGRPFPEHLPWWDEDAEGNADMWATEDESRAEIIGWYRRAWAHADATIDVLALDAPGRVSWWTWSPGVVLFNILVHVISETNRHAGHADILREQLDGPAVGADNPNLPEHDAAWWESYYERVERAARAAKPDKP
jgi:hypothetical protein